jgi:hypothetical protein
MKRTLKLQRETLTELTGDDLLAVVGAQALSGKSCPAVLCVDISRMYMTCGCQTSPC